MAEQSTTDQNKKVKVESKQFEGSQQTESSAPQLLPERPTLAGGGDSIERHIQLLGDNRIHVGKRQKLAGWLSRTQGNQYLQRVIDNTRQGGMIQRDPEDGTTEGGGAGEGETEAETLEEQLQSAMEGWGTDEAAILTAIRNASVPDRQRVLGNPSLMGQLRSELSGNDLLATLEALGAPLTDLLDIPMAGWGTDEATLFRLTSSAPADQRRAVIGNSGIMGRLRGELSGDDLLTVARNLANGLRTEEQVAVANGLFDLSAAPEGVIRNATGLLMLSTVVVDRNTAARILDGRMNVHYIEDLTQPPDPAALVTGYGYDPADFTVYYKPGSTTETMLVQTNAVGFQATTTDICGMRTLSLDRWKTLLVHETNHALNPDYSTPLIQYKSEFRAYWVAEYRNVADEDQRAQQIKAHILAGYPVIAAAYNGDEAVRNAIDAHTRPDANITNE
ncbi:MAG: hypothetical protein JXA42_13915 [Anaerolineales bacterium]|nr:hypothetical protein [Anaerolineales bacterium]